MRLGKALKLMRVTQNVGVREQAKEIGISASTLSRIERGMPADPAAVLKLLVWLIGREAA